MTSENCIYLSEPLIKGFFTILKDNIRNNSIVNIRANYLLLSWEHEGHLWVFTFLLHVTSQLIFLAINLSWSAREKRDGFVASSCCRVATGRLFFPLELSLEKKCIHLFNQILIIVPPWPMTNSRQYILTPVCAKVLTGNIWSSKLMVLTFFIFPSISACDGSQRVRMRLPSNSHVPNFIRRVHTVRLDAGGLGLYISLGPTV